ncbi:MAG: hypothetical protein QM713_14315 [Arachnia sp.]
MTATTIKVPSQLRDRLKVDAAQHGRTMAEHLEALLDEEARRRRLATLREQMAANPPDDDYRRETGEWQSDHWR